MRTTGEIFVTIITRKTLGAADKGCFPEVWIQEDVGGGADGGRVGDCTPRCLDFKFMLGERGDILMGYFQLKSLIPR